eukprot:TRINITY_DN5539_c0_g2_i1.p1 TRINITY_DN5539_c0_g2~~TRINITY_DN5539_c0_g2_i1.p1  ORF type:complete len:357 (-),score=106.57 TRINITY_DN5539_c0_g2_i1:10-1080(-)
MARISKQILDQGTEVFKEVSIHKEDDHIKDIQQKIQLEVSKVSAPKQAEIPNVEELAVEKVKELMANKQDFLEQRLTDIENRIKSQSYIKPQDSLDEIIEKAGKRGSDEPEPEPQPPQEPKGDGLDIRFAAFLNIGSVAELLKEIGNQGTVYIVGIKSGFGASELAGLIHEIKGETSEKIKTVTLDHMYFKDLKPFELLLQHSPEIKSLQLLSCPFSSEQVREIFEKIAGLNHKIEKFSIENALISDQAEELALAINKTKIKKLKLTSPKMKLSRLVEIFKNTLSESIEDVDFGVIRPDKQTTELLSEWKKKKKIAYNNAESVEVMRKTYSYQQFCLLYTSPSPRDLSTSRMPSSA